MKTKNIFLSFIILASIVLLSCGVGPAVKELKKINDEPSRYWIQFIKANGINAVNSDGDTLLIAACEADNVALVKACIKSGANPNIYSNRKRPPLYHAIANNNVDMVNFLLKEKAYVITEQYDLLRLCMTFYKSRSEEILQSLFKHVSKSDLDWSEKHESYFNIIDFIDLSAGQMVTTLKIFELLLENGYSPNSRDLHPVMSYFYPKNDENIKKLCMKFLEKHRHLATTSDFLYWNQVYQSMNIYDESFFKYTLQSIDDISKNRHEINWLFGSIVLEYKDKNDYQNLKEIIYILKQKGFNVSESDVLNRLISGLDYYIEDIKSREYHIEQAKSNEKEYGWDSKSNIEYATERIKENIAEINSKLNLPLIAFLEQEGFEFIIEDDLYSRAAKDILAYQTFISNYLNK